MPTASLQLSMAIGGVSIIGTVARTASGQMSHQVVVPAAAAGTMTTKTDADTGVATLSTGHGIISTDVVDVYWADGVRYGMVATVATNAVSLEGGAGDDLPVATTVVYVCKQVSIDMEVDGDTIEMIGAVATRRGHMHFQETGAASVLAQELIAEAPWTWSSDLGVTNPFASKAVVTVKVSNGDSLGTSTVTIGALVDSDS